MHLDIDINGEEIQQRKKLLGDWSFFENERPPVVVFMDSPFYCKLADIPIEQIYQKPEAMVKAQLIGWKRLLESVDCDNDGPCVGVDFGSCFTGATYGCELVEQPGSVPTTRPWFHDKNDIKRLSDIDPFEGEFQNKAKIYYNWMKTRSKDYSVRFNDGQAYYPLDSVELMTGSEGPFSILCMIAGMERISMWCYENPELIIEMMEIVTQKEIDRIQKSFDYMNKPANTFFLADDYSPYMPIDIYEKFILPFQKRLCAAFTKAPYFHSCIADKRLLRFWKEDLGISLFNGFKPQNGLENLTRDYSVVDEVMKGDVLLEPDLDGANILIADSRQLQKATYDFLEVFSIIPGVKLCYTLSGGHIVSDMEKCNIVKETVLM